MKNQVYHEWGKVEDVSEALPTFTTSDIGHFFIVGEVAADLGGNGDEEGELLPFSQPCEGGQGGHGEVLWRTGRDTSPRGSF